MVQNFSLIQRDLAHIWHPCTQMKDFERVPPLIIQEAKGSYLYTDKGPLIDAISSWWCKSLGHGHPVILEAISRQMNQFEHVIAANTTHPSLVELGEKLADISNKKHLYFACDGSSAVEIALKLALHAKQIQGEPSRNQFIALKNGYHGETFGALAVSDLGIYKEPYQSGCGLQCHFIEAGPSISSINDPAWQNAEAHWQQCLLKLEAIKDQVCAVIVEPLIQGGGGMFCYSADFLKRLGLWAKDNGIYFIADEIMTGMGRTGEWLACHYAAIEPDLICLSKGLTSGTLPLSLVLIDEAIYQLFYEEEDYQNQQHQPQRSFLHSHTHSGNAMSIAAALATIRVMESEGINEQAKVLSKYMQRLFWDMAETSQKITNVRCLGAMVAGDLLPLEGRQSVGSLVYEEALKQGVLLRPIGNTLYWMPPLNTGLDTMDALAEATFRTVKGVYGV